MSYDKLPTKDELTLKVQIKDWSSYAIATMNPMRKEFTSFPAALWPNIYGLTFHSSSNRVQWRVDVYLLGQVWDGRSQPIYENKKPGQQSPDLIRQKASAFWMAGLARAQAVQT